MQISQSLKAMSKDTRKLHTFPNTVNDCEWYKECGLVGNVVTKKKKSAFYFRFRIFVVLFNLLEPEFYI